jgi:hypothetical protein
VYAGLGDVRNSGELKPGIDGWLCEDVDAPHKQRHTARRVFSRLIESTNIPG